MPSRRPDGSMFKPKAKHYADAWKIGNLIDSFWAYKAPVFVKQCIENRTEGDSPSPYAARVSADPEEKNGNFFRTTFDRLPYTPNHMDNTGNAFPYHPPLICTPAQLGNTFSPYNELKKAKQKGEEAHKDLYTAYLGFVLHPYCSAHTWICSTFEENILRLYYQGELAPWRHVYCYGFESKRRANNRWDKTFIVTSLILGDYGVMPSDRFTKNIPIESGVIYPPE